MTSVDLKSIVSKYLDIFPEQRSDLQLLIEQVSGNEQMQTRKNFRGHITGGAMVLSSDKKKILAIHHKLFKKWLQPGGHWDVSDTGPWDAARREAEEETSVQISQLLPVFDDQRIPFDIGTHAIMARPERQEPTHYHHDFRYIFIAASNKLSPRTSEVNASVWMNFKDPRLRDMAELVEKLRRFKLIS